MVIRSRFLLAPKRKIFSSVLPALKRKRASLVRKGSAACVKLEFGKAFEMTIYFVPLLVTIRAMSGEDADDKSSTVSLGGGLRWPSLYQGLCPSDKDPTTAENNNGNASSSSSLNNRNNLHVLGVSGSYQSIGPIIAKKLEYASAQATYVLRRCFAETTVGKSAMANTEFEVEILEAGALIRFLQLARSTYMPDWVDVEG